MPLTITNAVDNLIISQDSMKVSDFLHKDSPDIPHIPVPLRITFLDSQPLPKWKPNRRLTRTVYG